MWYDWSNAEKDFSFQNFHVKLFITIPWPELVSILVLAKTREMHFEWRRHEHGAGTSLTLRDQVGRLTLRTGILPETGYPKGSEETKFIIGLRYKHCRIRLEFKSL